MWVLVVVVYSFFIYGLFEFFKASYRSIGKHIKKQNIKILINNNDEIEYLIRTLKNEFSEITVVLLFEDEETLEILKRLSNLAQIKIMRIEDLSRIEKS